MIRVTKTTIDLCRCGWQGARGVLAAPPLAMGRVQYSYQFRNEVATRPRAEVGIRGPQPRSTSSRNSPKGDYVASPGVTTDRCWAGVK